MAYEQRDNDGVLFRNDDPEPSAKAPEYVGRAMVGGVEYWVSAWVKEGKKAGKFFSMAFTLKEKKEPKGDDDDELPF